MLASVSMKDQGPWRSAVGSRGPGAFTYRGPGLNGGRYLSPKPHVLGHFGPLWQNAKQRGKTPVFYRVLACFWCFENWRPSFCKPAGWVQKNPSPPKARPFRFWIQGSWKKRRRRRSLINRACFRGDCTKTRRAKNRNPGTPSTTCHLPSTTSLLTANVNQSKPIRKSLDLPLCLDCHERAVESAAEVQHLAAAVGGPGGS